MTRSINFRYWKRVEADATAIQDFLSVGLQRVGEIRSRLNRGPAVGQIDPPGQAARYLANVLPDVRAEGIQWLVAYGHDERQLRVLSSQMATELGFPGLKAVLPRLVIAINRKRWPPKADVEVLIAGLQHRNLPVRRFSHGLLVHLFGTLEVYDSESSASSRNQQARKWLAAINRLYRRLGNSRQR